MTMLTATRAPPGQRAAGGVSPYPIRSRFMAAQYSLGSETACYTPADSRPSTDSSSQEEEGHGDHDQHLPSRLGAVAALGHCVGDPGPLPPLPARDDRPRPRPDHGGVLGGGR